MSDGANDGNGWKGQFGEKVHQLEAWRRDHSEEHRNMRLEIKELTKRNDRWSGALALLILLIGIIGPIIAGTIAKGHTP